MISVNIEKNLGTFKLKVNLLAQNGITAILGASGCGKSMTLRCIAGIEKPDRGTIILDGQTLFDSSKGINLSPQKRRVGYLFQNYALFPNMTVKKNILCGIKDRSDKKKANESLNKVIQLLRLEGLEKHRPNELSGGQQQRVALARILVGDPHILMLDEPFSALDSHLREQMQVEMKHLLKGYEKTVLLVTHNRTEAYNLSENIAVMEDGYIHTSKPTKALFSDPGTISGAKITGCKNIVPAVKKNKYEVEVPEWGVCFTTLEPVKDNLCAIGMRAHYFDPKEKINSFPVYKTDEVEEPFEWTICFRYSDGNQSEADIWWRFPKADKRKEMPDKLGIHPSNILLLYPNECNNNFGYY